MTRDSDGHDATPELVPDLEYDLAHEGEVVAGRVAATPADQRNEPEVYVATQTADYDGDYGYDLAHDVPGR